MTSSGALTAPRFSQLELQRTIGNRTHERRLERVDRHRILLGVAITP